MSFLSGLFSSKYKAKDFEGKTPKQILDDIKMDKLTNEIINDEGYSGLSEETKNAIQMLLDLKKGKLEIYNKCYNKPEPVRVAPAYARPTSARPASARPTVARPMSNRPPPVVHVGPFNKPVPAGSEGQTGGRRKRRTGRNKRTKRARKTRKH
jgi:hypothetical protein